MIQRRVGALAIVAGVAGLWACSPAFAVRPGQSSGRAEVSVTTQAEGAKAVKTVRGGLIHAVSVMGGTAPCTIIVYDATSSAGATEANIKWEGRTASNNETYSRVFPTPLVTDNGIYVEVLGTNAVGTVAYE